MTTTRLFQGITALAIGTFWLVPSVLADGQPQPKVQVAEAVVVAEKSEETSEPADVAAKPPESDAPAVQLPVWVPRTNRGAPASRIGGATRNGLAAGAGLVVSALVPSIDEAALTLSDQPALPFHLSRSTEHPVNFTLVDPDAIEPLLDITIPGPFLGGFHQIDLSAHGARLEAGHRYDWYVAVVPDQKRRSADVSARGSVERVAQPAPLAAQIAAARPDQRAAVLARAGIWYDALDTLRSVPVEVGSAQRDALLAQVGIELGAPDSPTTR